MYAIIRSGGKQFRAEPGKTIRVPSLEGEPGSTITFDDVVLGADGDKVKVGTPAVGGASVTGEIVKHGRGDKIVVFKNKRRKKYKRTRGHRQGFTAVKIDSIG